MKWDDGIAAYDEISRPNQYCQVVHIVTKSPLSYKNRDFIDKRIYFKHQGVYYIYINFVSDDIKLPSKDCERAKSVMGCFKISKTEDGRVRMMAQSQTDLKVRLLICLISF